MSQSKFLYGVCFTLFLFCVSLIPFRAVAEEGTSTGRYESQPDQSSDRFFRRVILTGSLVNAGYQGGGSSRYNNANGYSAGVLLDLAGTSNLVLETGALYRHLGTTVDNGLARDNAYTANYLSVPITAKYYFNGQENTSFYAKAGLMGSTLVSDNTAYIAPTTKIGARSWEASLLGGLGFKVNVASSSDLLIEADYNRSIQSVFPGTDIYRSDLTGSLGVAFNL